MVETLHRDCVACLAQDDTEPAAPVLTVLRMLLGDESSGVEPIPLEQIVGDLCLPHRLRVERQ